MMKIFLILIFIIFTININYAQNELATLNAEQLLLIVKQYHPIVKQASINIKKSDADIQIAKSVFDPIISNYSTKKTFDGTNYYVYTAPEITIPTWYGIDINSGTELLNGARLDPTQTSGQTNFIGVNIPVLKNIVLDKRRAIVQQAKLFNAMAIVEQQVVINNLLMDAMEKYWMWVKAYQTYKIIKNNVTTNEKRVELIKKSFVNGERPSIDTVEAITQLQSFQLLQNEQWLQFQQAGLELSTFLWDKNSAPYNLQESVVPLDGWDNEINITKFNIILSDLLQLAEKTHPELSVYNYKLDILNIEKKLKYQELLPKLDLKYNILGKDYNVAKTIGESTLFQNNFQYGLKFEMPILIRKGRGEYKKANLKIEETKLDIAQKQLYIQTKIKNYYNEFVTLRNQVALQSSNYNNNTKLVKAEEIRFFNGESSLFLINIREVKALESLEKLISLKTKYFKTIYTLQWSAGLLQ